MPDATTNIDQSKLANLKQFVHDKSPHEAIETAEKILTDQPHHVETLVYTAEAYRLLLDKNKAVQFMEKAIRLEPANLGMQIYYINDLLRIGRVDDAADAIEKLTPEHQNDPKILLLKSHVYYQRKDYKTATDIRVELIQKYPKFSVAHLELAHVLLMRGKWRAGWIEYEYRWNLPYTRDRIPKFKIPQWDGSTYHKSILLIGDQGYGDCFMFGRYIPLVARFCGEVKLIRSKPIARLMDTVEGVSAGYQQWQDVKYAEAYCTLSGLPRRLGTRPDSIPSCEHLLKVDEKDNQRWSKKISKATGEAKLSIGIAWTGRLDFLDNFLRAVPIENIESLLNVTEVRFFSLQVGDLAHQAEGRNMLDLSADFKDFTETAAAMNNLDLIITSDTSIAHLSGTLGRPTWAMVHYSPDWRWGSEGMHSDWYPATRVFRQNNKRSWEAVIDDCKRALGEILASDDPRTYLKSQHLKFKEALINS